MSAIWRIKEYSNVRNFRQVLNMGEEFVMCAFKSLCGLVSYECTDWVSITSIDCKGALVLCLHSSMAD